MKTHLQKYGYSLLFGIVAVLFIFLTAVPSWAILVTKMLNPTDDSYVNSKFPNTNYGTAYSLLLVGKEAPNQYTTYVQFDLQGIPNDAILSSAVLSLHLGTVSGTSNVQLSWISNDAWKESAITFNSRPNLSGARTSLGLQTITSSSWVTWNFNASSWTTFAQDLYDSDDTLSLMLTITSESNGQLFSFDSKESANVPSLTITYEMPQPPAPVPIPAAAWLLGSGLIGLIAIRRRFRK